VADTIAGLILEFEQSIITLDRLRAQSVLAHGIGLKSSIEAADKIIGPALERIGFGWQEGRISLSQLYMSGRICEEVLDEILPSACPDLRRAPKLAIAVLQDHHTLGKRVVHAALHAAGFAVEDFGRVDVYELVDRVVAERVDVLLISAIMQNSAMRVKEARKRLDAARADVKIIVGGAPFRFDTYLWQDVGADAMGFDATDAIRVVKQLIGETP
jgi:methanogenic corrinoid protein MtbC1